MNSRSSLTNENYLSLIKLLVDRASEYVNIGVNIFIREASDAEYGDFFEFVFKPVTSQFGIITFGVVRDDEYPVFVAVDTIGGLLRSFSYKRNIFIDDDSAAIFMEPILRLGPSEVLQMFDSIVHGDVHLYVLSLRNRLIGTWGYLRFGGKKVRFGGQGFCTRLRVLQRSRISKVDEYKLDVYRSSNKLPEVSTGQA